MAFCDARALCRLACTSARLAGLASDNLLWRNLYAAALPPCTHYGLPCLADAVDAWCFVAGDRHGDNDGLDHGPSRRLPEPGVAAIDGGTHAAGHAAQGVADGGGVVLQPTALSNTTTDIANDALRPKALDRWWTHRCARLTRLAADRVTGSGTALAHPACPHPPPSLVRAHGYRWAYAAAAMPPLVRKVHHGVGHVHCVVHRGARDGLASQCETCLAGADACGIVWRWGRFADCFLAGLGTEALATAPRDPCDGQSCTVTAGVWSEGVAYGVVVRRAAGAITIEVATAGAQWHDDPMDRDQINGPRHRALGNSRLDSDDSDDSDDDPTEHDDGSALGKRSGRTHAAAVVYYAQEGDLTTHGRMRASAQATSETATVHWRARPWRCPSTRATGAGTCGTGAVSCASRAPPVAWLRSTRGGLSEADHAAAASSTWVTACASRPRGTACPTGAWRLATRATSPMPTATGCCATGDDRRWPSREDTPQPTKRTPPLPSSSSRASSLPKGGAIRAAGPLPGARWAPSGVRGPPSVAIRRSSTRKPRGPCRHGAAATTCFARVAGPSCCRVSFGRRRRTRSKPSLRAMSTRTGSGGAGGSGRGRVLPAGPLIPVLSRPLTFSFPLVSSLFFSFPF